MVTKLKFQTVMHSFFITSNINLKRSLTVPGILNEAVPATTQNVDTEIQRTVRDAYKYTGIVEKICYNERDDPPSGLSMQLLKEALINSRQHEAFLRVLLVRLMTI